MVPHLFRIKGTLVVMYKHWAYG